MNAIVICLDTYRADCVAAAGRNKNIQTPNLDRLCREGVLFDNAFGEGQPTIQYRRCLATGKRAFPFTGQYDTVGLWPCNAGWHKIDPQQPTMAEVLLEKGYATALVADTYHMFKPTQNFTRGMASWKFIRGQETDNYRCGPLDAIDLGKYTKKGVTSEGGLPVIVQYLLNMQGRQGEDDYLPAQVFSAAIETLREVRNAQPFYLWIDSFDPHEPFDPPKRYADLYDPDWDEGWEPIHAVPDDADERILRRVKALYYGSCTFVDKQVGRLLDALDDLDLADDTLVLVTSDHGLELHDHGHLHKGTHKSRYRPNNEILALMRLPGHERAGTRVREFVMNQDFFPTIMNLLGVEHDPVDGFDMMPLVRGETDRLRDHVLTGWAGGSSGIRVSVRTHEWAYSCDAYDDPMDEHLFDLTNDPFENINVAGAHPDVCAEYRARVEEYLGEPLPATRKDKLFYTKTPCKIWMENAPWAAGLEDCV